MDDEKRLELMQQMLSRLRGQPDAQDTPAAAFGEAAEAEPAGSVAAEDLIQDPAAARLRVLEELLDRLGG